MCDPSNYIDHLGQSHSIILVKMEYCGVMCNKFIIPNSSPNIVPKSIWIDRKTMKYLPAIGKNSYVVIDYININDIKYSLPMHDNIPVGRLVRNIHEWLPRIHPD